MAATTSTGTRKTSAAKTKPAATKKVAASAGEIVEAASAVEDGTAESSEAAVKDMNVETKEAKSTEPVAAEEPLKDSDEIEVVALIPNVSYRDPATADYYEWENVGDVEYMTVDALTRMRRNFRAYFEDMCIKPNDERVIKKFNLNRFYDKYDVFMDASSYTKKNIVDTLNEFSAIRSNSMKLSIVNKIKDMVASGDISDVNVIRTIEKRLDIDLIATL